MPLIATRSVGSAEVLASEIGARPVTADQLPGSAEAVVVATPPPDHAALAVRLLSAGTAVLIEKPLAATLTEADAIVAAAEATGAAACYAENLLFAPALDVAVNRRVALAMRWIVTYARDRGEKTMRERLAGEAHPANRDVPIFMAHGTGDSVIPHPFAQQSAELLRAAGYPLEWRSYPMEHSLCLPEVRDIEDWLARVLAA